MSAEWDDFYDLLGKKEGWTIEEVRIMFFPKEFLDDDETFNPSKTVNEGKPLWTKMHELMLAAIDIGSIKFLNNSSNGKLSNNRLSPASVIGWIQFQEIFKWLVKKGWEKPEQLDDLIKSLNKFPFDGTKTQMEKEVADLKNKIEELEKKNKKLRAQAKNTGKEELEDHIEILKRGLKNVNREKKMFHPDGILNASKLTEIVHKDFEDSSADSTADHSHESIKGRLTKAINKTSQNKST